MPFTSEDLFLIGFLVFLEGILSIDNALVLAMMAKRLPFHQRKKALSYGLFGAVFFRLAALGLTSYLLKWTWVKFVGGAYLVFIALKHLLFGEPEGHSDAPKKSVGFWRTVLAIELMDIAFAVDSILAAVALTPKFWVVFTGGFLGVVMMRFAASQFLKLLARFPNFETTAYLLVLVIGVKVILEGLHLQALDFHSPRAVAFWVFWALMAACVAYGLKPKQKRD